MGNKDSKAQSTQSFKSTGSASSVSPVNQGLKEDESHLKMGFDTRRKENNKRRKDSKVSILESTPLALDADKAHNNRSTDSDQLDGDKSSNHISPEQIKHCFEGSDNLFNVTKGTDATEKKKKGKKSKETDHDTCIDTNATENTDDDSYNGKQNTDSELQKTIDEHPISTGCDQLDGALSSNQKFPDSNKQKTYLSFESSDNLINATKGTDATEKKKMKRKKSKKTEHDTCIYTNATEKSENGLENISLPKSKKKKNPFQSLKNKSKRKIDVVGCNKLETDLRTESEKGECWSEQYINEMIKKTKSLEQACGRNLSVLSGKTDEYMCPQEFLQSMNRIEDFLEHLIKENKDYINRLSRLAGDRMTDNNPNIMDLNDPNRPIKLAEQYSQLYDNEWTDAMERLEKMVPRSNDKKEKCAQYLFSLITAVYKYCKKRSKQQLDGLTEQLFLMKNPSVEQVNDMLSQNQTERKKFIESRKHTASIAVMMLQQTLKDDDTFIKENEGCFADLDTKIINKLRRSTYFKKCIELCWQFVIQDPPMYLETFSIEGTTINKDTHKLYTQSGYRVKYVVWPALYLHEDKQTSLMAKGVVQPEKQEQIA